MLTVSLYFNSMSSIEEINPVGEYSISIIDEIPDIIYTDLFRSSDVRSQTSFGPQIEYQALNLNRFSLGIGIGVNYNIYFRKVFRESGLNNSLSYSYVSRHQKGIGKLGYLNFDYSLKENIGIGFKFRVTEFVDYNVGFSIGLKLKV